MKVKQGFKLRPLGNEFILVGEGLEQINFNKMITMNETAAYLWQKVMDGQDFDADRLAELLVEEYEVGHEQALQDATMTIESWLKAEIIA
ncbi:MAG: PqqD family protein [Paludibacteraceae bacterium]|nr:PqqD family protein [Paludibacteraceae bacterium]